MTIDRWFCFEVILVGGCHCRYEPDHQTLSEDLPLPCVHPSFLTTTVSRKEAMLSVRNQHPVLLSAERNSFVGWRPSLLGWRPIATKLEHAERSSFGLPVASLQQVAGVTLAILLLVVIIMPFVPSSFLLLVVRPGAPSSFLVYQLWFVRSFSIPPRPSAA